MAIGTVITPGLGNATEFEKVSVVELTKPPIERLHPSKKLHQTVLSYLLDRLNSSEIKMRNFHSRWKMAEMQHQAYLNLSNYEKILKAARQDGKPPELTSVVVPYAFATVNTVVTYHINAFAGRKPIFTLDANDPQSLDRVSYQELMLQHNADHSNLVRQFYDNFYSGQIYSLGVLKNLWHVDKAKRSAWVDNPLTGKRRVREMKVVYEGNKAECVDPFMFFPDTSVPLCDLAEKGEFVVFRAFPGKHALLSLEEQGVLRYVNSAGTMPADAKEYSDRFTIINPMTPRTQAVSTVPVIQEDTFCIRIIPKELQLGESKYPELWLFTVLNKKVIVQAVPLDNDHGMLPVTVHEPYSTGYGFGNYSLVDLLSPMQDSMSWMLNSHIYNVRAVLNNMFVIDPGAVELSDLKDPKPGKLIRLKNAAMGRDVRSVIQQFNVTDVTQNHMNDFNLFMRMGDTIVGVNDNFRGMSEPNSSRKTATEVRTSLESGMSRLAAQARMISAQQMINLGKMMSMNISQYLTKEYSFKVLGEKGVKIVNVDPQMVVGDFTFPVHDGSLPVDKVAMLGVWKEIMMGVAQQPTLSQNFDIVKIFEHVAELGGARDINRFKVNPVASVQPDEAVAQQAQAGNLVPVSELNNVGI